MSPAPFEKAKVTRATREADPVTYSTTVPKGLTQVGTIDLLDGEVEGMVSRAVFRDADGNTYYEITHAPEVQRIIIRIMKGIVNVADVIAVPGKTSKDPTLFISKELNLSKDIAAASMDELDADVYIFRTVFSDADHSLYRGNMSQHEKTNVNDPKEGGNLRYKDGKGYHFDFFNPQRHFFSSMFEVKGDHNEITNDSLSAISHEGLQNIQTKLQALHTRFKGEEGKEFLRNIIAPAKKDISQLFNLMPYLSPPSRHDPLIEEPFERFYQTLMGRIEDEQKKIANHLSAGK